MTLEVEGGKEEGRGGKEGRKRERDRSEMQRPKDMLEEEALEPVSGKDQDFKDALKQGFLVEGPT